VVSDLRWRCSLVVAFAEAGVRSLSRTICARLSPSWSEAVFPLPSSQTPDRSTHPSSAAHEKHVTDAHGRDLPADFLTS
jgi:hypothetical protein